MKLYYSPGACSLASHIALEEAGAKYAAVRVDLKTRKTEDGADFAALNAKGYVPALTLDDGTLITEGPAILQYVAETHPNSHLMPVGDAKASAIARSWLTFIGTEIHKQFSPLFRGAQGEARDNAIKAISNRLDFVEKTLSDGRAYLTGETFNVADAYLFTIVGWTKFAGIDLGAWPKLAAYQARVAGRPATQRAMKGEGLI
jgi:glutathione S-transferase